ncbi:hypothetical protein F5146DRAFT_1142104 [Armillaria mellea]|nr:hypothetical protein F5146DRAFT_1142104 [Armillaria mellea]
MSDPLMWQFYLQIPVGKLKFLVAQILHKQKRTACKFSLDKDKLMQMVEHTQVFWDELCSPLNATTKEVVQWLTQPKNAQYIPEAMSAFSSPSSPWNDGDKQLQIPPSTLTPLSSSSPPPGLLVDGDAIKLRESTGLTYDASDPSLGVMGSLSASAPPFLLELPTSDKEGSSHTSHSDQVSLEYKLSPDADDHSKSSGDEGGSKLADLPSGKSKPAVADGSTSMDIVFEDEESQGTGDWDGSQVPLSIVRPSNGLPIKHRKTVAFHDIHTHMCISTVNICRLVAGGTVQTCSTIIFPEAIHTLHPKAPFIVLPLWAAAILANDHCLVLSLHGQPVCHAQWDPFHSCFSWETPPGLQPEGPTWIWIHSTEWIKNQAFHRYYETSLEHEADDNLHGFFLPATDPSAPLMPRIPTHDDLPVLIHLKGLGLSEPLMKHFTIEDWVTKQFAIVPVGEDKHTVLLLPRDIKQSMSQLYIGFLELNQETGHWACTTPSFLQGGESTHPTTTGIPLSTGESTFHLICQLSSGTTAQVQGFHTQDAVKESPKMWHYKLGKTLTWDQLLLFLWLAHRIVPPAYVLSKETLESNKVEFLTAAMNLPAPTISKAWLLLRPLVYLLLLSTRASDNDVFQWLGADCKVRAARIPKAPPQCCGATNLPVKALIEARLYTVSWGLLPIYVKSYYCRKCHMRYMPNYKVMAASEAEAEHIYLPELPHIIGATRMVYFKVKLIEVFQQVMLTLHASALGLVQWYNDSLQTPATNVSNNFVLNNKLMAELVYEAFFLHGLILDAYNCAESLVLPNGGKQQDCMDKVLEVRNK